MTKNIELDCLFIQEKFVSGDIKILGFLVQIIN